MRWGLRSNTKLLALEGGCEIPTSFHISVTERIVCYAMDSYDTFTGSKGSGLPKHEMKLSQL